MNVNTKLDDIVVVGLSRKNLNGLLEQLDEKRLGDPAQIMRKIDGTLFIVTAEENGEHYNSIEREESVRGHSGASADSQAYAERHA
jgi:hypothetical protein